MKFKQIQYLHLRDNVDIEKPLIYEDNTQALFVKASIDPRDKTESFEILILLNGALLLLIYFQRKIDLNL